MNGWAEARGQSCQIKEKKNLEKGSLAFWGSMRDLDLPVILFQKKNKTRITDVAWIRRGCVLLMLVSPVKKCLLLFSIS